MIIIDSPRLQLSQFQMSDAKDVFACITPSITRYMRWEPLPWNEYIELCKKRTQTLDPNSIHFVIRRLDNKECLGRCALEEANTVTPEIGLWLKESVHGQGFGREVVAALTEWGFKTLNKESFLYPVAVQNTASRRIAEGLGGELVGSRSNPKYESVVYRISRKTCVLFFIFLMVSIFLTAIPAYAQDANASSFFDNWSRLARKVREEQPHWLAPLTSYSPRLEQGFRYDQLVQNKPHGIRGANYGNAKGFAFITGDNTAVYISPPAYLTQRTPRRSLSGSSDTTLYMQYRFLSGNEEHGNYVVSGFLGTSLPTGSKDFSFGRAIPIVAAAAGTGWGTRDYGFDVQSMLTYALEEDLYKRTGRPLIWNTTFQGHIGKFWPEVDATYTHFTDAPFERKTQIVLTYGLNLGKLDITERAHIVVGAGYQQTVSNFHAYLDHGWIMTARVPF